MSQTDHGIIVNIKEVVLDEGVLLFRVQAEIDNSKKNEQEKAESISDQYCQILLKNRISS